MGAFATRRFSQADQSQFALMSGDVNPLHMNSEWAASVFPGDVVVHGIHAVLWGCNEYFVQNPLRSLSSIDVKFDKPILLDEDVVATYENTQSGIRIIFQVRDANLIVANLVFGMDANQLQPPLPPENAEPLQIANPDMSEMTGSAGFLSLPPDAIQLEAAFPALAKALGSTALVGLASLSTLVGMKSPGLHGLFSAFSVEISGATGPLAYEVTKADPRFSRIEMKVSGYGLDGKVIAFSTKGSRGATESTERDYGIEPTEFQGQCPLVIGASSGLGLATVRMLATGGAQPVVTWHSSPRSIDPVRAEIAEQGGQCTSLCYRADDSASFVNDLTAGEWRGRDIYFFATPRIFRRRLETFEPELLKEFMAVYVDGFYSLVSNLVRTYPNRHLKFFYPSSILAGMAKPESLEYGIAKLAGEQLCSRLKLDYPDIDIMVERLAGIDTRQTVSVTPTSLLSPGEAMLPIIRQMQAAAE